MFTAVAFVKRRLGRWDEALESMQKAVALDPKNSRKMDELRDIAYCMRKWDLAHRYVTQLSALQGGDEFGVEISRYILNASRYGDTQHLQTLVDELSLKYSPEELTFLRMMNLYFQRDFSALLEFMENGPIQPWPLMSETLMHLDEPEKAGVFFDSLRIQAEAWVEKAPDNWSGYGPLGEALAGLGQFEKAIQMGQKGVELMPLSKDAIHGSSALENMANIYTACSRYEEAISIYDQLLSRPNILSVNVLKLMPMFDPMRDNPHFLALLEKYGYQSD